MSITNQQCGKSIKKLEVPAVSNVIAEHDERLMKLEAQVAELASKEVPQAPTIDTTNLISVEDLNFLITDLQENLQLIATSTPRDIADIKNQIEELKQKINTPSEQLRQEVTMLTGSAEDVPRSIEPIAPSKIPKLTITKKK